MMVHTLPTCTIASSTALKLIGDEPYKHFAEFFYIFFILMHMSTIVSGRDVISRIWCIISFLLSLLLLLLCLQFVSLHNNMSYQGYFHAIVGLDCKGQWNGNKNQKQSVANTITKQAKEICLLFLPMQKICIFNESVLKFFYLFATLCIFACTNVEVRVDLLTQFQSLIDFYYIFPSLNRQAFRV